MPRVYCLNAYLGVLYNTFWVLSTYRRLFLRNVISRTMTKNAEEWRLAGYML